MFVNFLTFKSNVDICGQESIPLKQGRKIKENRKAVNQH